MQKRCRLEINFLEKYQHQVLQDQIKRINIFLNYNMVNFKEILVSFLNNYLIITKLLKHSGYLKQQKLIQSSNHSTKFKIHTIEVDLMKIKVELIMKVK